MAVTMTSSSVITSSSVEMGHAHFRVDAVKVFGKMDSCSVPLDHNCWYG